MERAGGYALACLATLLVIPVAIAAQSLQGQLPLIEEYCTDCHNLDDYAGSLDLSLIIPDDIAAHPETWEKVIRKLRAGIMPPAGADRPQWDT